MRTEFSAGDRADVDATFIRMVARASRPLGLCCICRRTEATVLLYEARTDADASAECRSCAQQQPTRGAKRAIDAMESDFLDGEWQRLRRG